MRVIKRVQDLIFPRRRNSDIQGELELHFEAIVAEYKQAGMADEDARRAARRRFGSMMSIKDRGHDVRGAGWIEGLLRDVRHAARRLIHAPAFSISAVLTLALAIGANASIFTVVHRVVWNPLPYASPDRLIALDYGIPARNINSGITDMTWQLYWQLTDRARSLESIAVSDTLGATLTGRGVPERLRMSRATPSLAHVLGVSPALGRWFKEEEGVPGAVPAAVLSHGLWVRRFGENPNLLGTFITIDGATATVVGVMPAAFAYPDARIDLWMPAQSTRADASFLFAVNGVARLRDGASIATARAEITQLTADLARTSPNQTGLVSAAMPLQEMVVGNVARALWTLLAAVGVVLLVACANVANLFLVRYESRQREIAVRRALGAGRRGVLSYFLSESVLLAMTGGLLGLAFAWIGVRFLLILSPANLPRLEEVRLDGTVVAFTAVISVVSALFFSAIPLLRLKPLTVSLHETGRGSIGRGSHRGRHVLMGAQVTLALMLLIASGLMIRSFQKLRAVDPGFDFSSVLTFRIGLPEREYSSRQSGVAAHKAILEKLAAIPGVQRASASSCLPLSGSCFGNALFMDGEPQERTLARGFVWFRAVASGYFEAMGMRLIRGRTFDRSDIDHDEPNIVVNQALANTFFPGRDPIGQRVLSSTPPNSTFPKPRWMTIVGVVSNTATYTLADAAPAPQLFMPMSVAGGPDFPMEALIGPNVSTLSYVLRSSIPAPELASAVRAAVAEVDSNLALAQVRTMQDIVDRASDQTAFMMTLLAIAAAVALLLGIVGIYGVVSYVVSQRTSEIGVRLALGAQPRNVAAMIVRQGGLVVAVGAFVGLVLALAGGRLIESLLYGVSSRDPVVIALTTTALLTIAIVACWLPARRAARISPVDGLRAD
jgi:putative ABC transport system permease protein